MALPEEDRLNDSREGLLDRICMCLGGRIAEELKFGQQTSGASDDLRRASHIARVMVAELGMSDALGPLSYGDRDEGFSMGPSFRQKDYSEAIAQKIDAEVARIVNEQYTRGKSMLEEHRATLDSLAEALLDRETLDREEIDAVMEGKELPPRERVILPRYSEKSRQQKERRKASIFQPRPREVPSGG
jgi:cell division protease FtsH